MESWVEFFFLGGGVHSAFFFYIFPGTSMGAALEYVNGVILGEILQQHGDPRSTNGWHVTVLGKELFAFTQQAEYVSLELYQEMILGIWVKYGLDLSCVNQYRK